MRNVALANSWNTISSSFLYFISVNIYFILFKKKIALVLVNYNNPNVL